MFGIDWGALGNALISPILTALQNLVMWVLGQAWNFLNWLWTQVPTLIPWPGPAVGPMLNSVLTDAAPTLTAINYYTPLNLAAVLFMVILSEEAILATWHGFRWLLSHLPGVGGEM